MLRDVVYDYLWTQIREKQFKPGEFVNLNLISQKLGVSRTPLREALIVLEAEGFVQILPKRGIYIKPLTLQETYNLYEAIGALESSIIMSVWSKIDENFIRTLERINGEIAACTDYARHYELNHEFHFAYINLSENTEIKNYLGRLYQRIYDFSGINYGQKFQSNNCAGHAEFIRLLREGNPVSSADYLRDVHWKFRVPEVFHA